HDQPSRRLIGGKTVPVPACRSRRAHPSATPSTVRGGPWAGSVQGKETGARRRVGGGVHVTPLGWKRGSAFCTASARRPLARATAKTPSTRLAGSRLLSHSFGEMKTCLRASPTSSFVLVTSPPWARGRASCPLGPF